jgi:tetratricopeptide (TPR) repeat protein
MNPDDSNSSLQKQAIDAALSYNWEEAVLLNKQIMKDQPEDIDCLNRLARAFFEMGKYPQAKKLYQTVLKIDPYNSIAQKNLKRVGSFKNAPIKDGTYSHTNHTTMVLSPSLFLEEPGVTTVVNLTKLAEPQRLGVLYPGLMVSLNLKNRRICVTDLEGNYLGVLPDDMSHLILKLMSGGNKYQSIIKSVKSNGLTILIRETFRSKKFRNQPSFLTDSHNFAYSSDHISLSEDDDSRDDSGDSEDSMS